MAKALTDRQLLNMIKRVKPEYPILVRIGAKMVQIRALTSDQINPKTDTKKIALPRWMREEVIR